MFSVMSFTDLGRMLGCFIWLPFTLRDFVQLLLSSGNSIWNHIHSLLLSEDPNYDPNFGRRNIWDNVYDKHNEEFHRNEFRNFTIFFVYVFADSFNKAKLNSKLLVFANLNEEMGGRYYHRYTVASFNSIISRLFGCNSLISG